jgi:hypothetical protein
MAKLKKYLWDWTKGAEDGDGKGAIEYETDPAVEQTQFNRS